MTQTINEAGLDLIKSFESCVLTSYQDVKGVWTIGYGHIKGVTHGMRITQAQADQFLREDLAGAEAAVNGDVGSSPTSANQFSAMVSLCFNIGAGAFAGSTVLREHRAGKFSAAADAFLLWNKATIKGVQQTVPGLTRRRTAEKDLYLTP